MGAASIGLGSEANAGDILSHMTFLEGVDLQTIKGATGEGGGTDGSGVVVKSPSDRPSKGCLGSCFGVGNGSADSEDFNTQPTTAVDEGSDAHVEHSAFALHLHDFALHASGILDCLMLDLDEQGLASKRLGEHHFSVHFIFSVNVICFL